MLTILWAMGVTLGLVGIILGITMVGIAIGQVIDARDKTLNWERPKQIAITVPVWVIVKACEMLSDWLLGKKKPIRRGK